MHAALFTLSNVSHIMVTYDNNELTLRTSSTPTAVTQGLYVSGLHRVSHQGY